MTGGAGFIGSALVDRLLAEGHAVDVVDDLSTGSLANLAQARSGAQGLRFTKIDIRSPDLVDVMRRCRPEVVYHLAARSDAAASVDAPAADAEVNVVGSLRVVEGAHACGAAKVVFASDAAAVYGEVAPADLPVRESQPQRPVTPYGVAKKSVADYLATFRDLYELEYTALALASVYGPRRRSGVVATLAARLLAADPATDDDVGPTDGRSTRDLVFVDDVVDAFARAADRGGGLVLNIGTGRETSVESLWRMLASAIGTDVPAPGAPPSPGGSARACVDASRAALHLGWKPWTALPEGVAATVEWMTGGGH